MTYIIRTLGWADKEVLLFALAHLILICWTIVLILNSQSISLIVLALNYSVIFALGSFLTKLNKKFANKSDELD